MSVPSGWYQDPQQAEQLRYWDGQAWTHHTAPMAVGPPAHRGQGATNYQSGMSGLAISGWIIGGVVAVCGLAMVVAAVTTSGGSEPTTASGSEATGQSAEEDVKDNGGTRSEEDGAQKSKSEDPSEKSTSDGESPSEPPSSKESSAKPTSNERESS